MYIWCYYHLVLPLPWSTNTSWISSVNIAPHRRSSKDSLTSGAQIVDENIEDEDTSPATSNILNQTTDPNSHLAELRIVPLYILGEKSQMKVH